MRQRSAIFKLLLSDKTHNDKHQETFRDSTSDSWLINETLSAVCLHVRGTDDKHDQVQTSYLAGQRVVSEPYYGRVLSGVVSRRVCDVNSWILNVHLQFSVVVPEIFVLKVY